MVIPALLLLWLALCVPSPTSAFEPVDEHWLRPVPVQAGTPPAGAPRELVADLSASACGLCHAAQFDAWSESLHARALSAGVLGQLDAFDRETQRDCLLCHAPREDVVERWLDGGLGAAGHLAGVDCATCHVRHRVRFGPRALAETPHGPVQALPLFRDAAFCAPCHQFDASGLSVNGKPLENTYVEWRDSRYARAGVTCQACHMPQGRHGFKGIHDPETTRAGLRVQAWRLAEGLRAAAGNLGAGHALPTYVTPRILIRLEGDGGAPLRQHAIARRMRWSQDAGWEELADDRLFPDQWITLDLALPVEQGGRVSVRVEPGWDYHERIYPLLFELLADRLSPSARTLLERARTQAAARAYTLIELDCPPWAGATQPCVEQPGR